MYHYCIMDGRKWVWARERNKERERERRMKTKGIIKNNECHGSASMSMSSTSSTLTSLLSSPSVSEMIKPDCSIIALLFCEQRWADKSKRDQTQISLVPRTYLLVISTLQCHEKGFNTSYCYCA